MGATAAVAMLLRREREIVGAFRAARATSPDTGVTLDAVSVHDGVALRRLQQRVVVRSSGETAPARYYLDEPVWNATRRMRRRMAAIVLLVFAVCSVMAWLAGSAYAR